MKREYDVILFDLDGTLLDTGEGITKCAQYALHKFGLEVSDLSELNYFVGPPLKDSFVEYAHIPEEKAAEAIRIYRERYQTIGLYECEIYQGISQVLQACKDAGKKLLVTTSKPEEMAMKVLKHAGLDGYFDFIGGALMDETRGRKAEVISYALEASRLSQVDKSRIVLVGDRKFDVLGAAECGIDCLGVLYGYGSRQELEEAGAFAVAETPEDILQVVL